MIIMDKTSFSYNWKVDKLRTALTVRKSLFSEDTQKKMHQICNTTDMGADVSVTFKKCYDFFFY